jgi:hypothetical protein
MFNAPIKMFVQTVSEVCARVIQGNLRLFTSVFVGNHAGLAWYWMGVVISTTKTEKRAFLSRL